MLWATLFLASATLSAMAYPTDSPISEPPNIVLASPDDMDNAIGALDISETSQEDGDCEPEVETTAFRVKRSDEQEQQQPRRCSNQNFIRFGRASAGVTSELDSPGNKEGNFIRLGRGGKSNDNFIRLGRQNKDSNFIRFGRDKSDSFIRFGRGKTDNFIRFGRGRTDNFIRLGKGKVDNFIRLGKGKPDNFIRFGRGKQDNFIRFGRGMKDNFVRFGRDGLSNVDDSYLDSDFVPNDNTLRVSRGGNSDSNFIRFGRGGSNFIRLGRGNDAEITEREERSRANNFVRFGRNYDDEDFLRLSRSGNSNDLRRGKLTDRNFIRLGRSESQYETQDTDENSVRSSRSNTNRNFIRLGKRTDQSLQNHLLRFGRDVEQIDEMPVLSSTESNQSDLENKTDKEEYRHSRNKRSLSFPNEEDTTEDSSDYPIIIGSNNYGEKQTSGDPKTPFGYYSPLTSGIPNYILGPELAVLAPLSNGAESKRAKARDHNRNYIRLG
ncbi:hypothetical protein C0J52_20050 [Blattella germanica]|nr:hypothetical protein C0J52_20050 [Blattella germanica]